MTKIRILSAEAVYAALSMPEAIETAKSAFRQVSTARAVMPLRTRLQVEKGITLLMPAYLRDSREMAVKAVSVFEQNPSRGLPTVTALVLVFDPETGVPLALMDGTALTALRTGAAGGVAADLLARPNARKVTLFGPGVQGRTQLLGVMAVRKITEVSLIGRTEASAQKLAEEIRTWPNPPNTRVQPPVPEAVRDADIVITATPSVAPLFDGRDLKPGTHVTAIGAFTPEMQEVDAATVARARVFVDSREACLAEAGDLIRTQAHIEAEIGEVLQGIRPGRQASNDITLFKSVGLAAQDATAAAAVLKRARERHLGTLLSL